MATPPLLMLSLDDLSRPGALALAGAVLGLSTLALLRGASRKRRARAILFREERGLDPAAAPAAPADPLDLEESGIERWLARAGHDGPGARTQFLLRSVAAVLAAAFIALLVEASGYAEVGASWLEEVPAGLGEALLPIMKASSWLIALLIAAIPIVSVRRRQRQRNEEIERDLPTVLELLATLVEAGLGFDAALIKVGSALGQDRALTLEFERVRAATMAGVDRATAIRAMAGRLDVPSLTSFSSALIHAENQGASIGVTLRSQATDLWSQRREGAIQRAQVLPTKLAFPLVICFLPGVFVWTFGPAVAAFLRLAETVGPAQP